MTNRTASLNRTTTETQVTVTVALDGVGRHDIATGIGFLDHMLVQIARHGLVDLNIEARGDHHIDDHHTVEDVALTLGAAVAQALGERRGITRYGYAYVPMDEALARVVLDLSNRPMLVWDAPFSRDKIGTFDTELVREWFQGFATALGATLHATVLAGDNQHHRAEALFKALGRALRAAVSLESRLGDQVPSSKGTLTAAGGAVGLRAPEAGLGEGAALSDTLNGIDL